MNLQENLLPFDGQAYYLPQFLPDKISDETFVLLIEEIPWEAKQIKLFGKLIDQPRLSSWHGEKGCTYKYSGVEFQPKPLSTRLEYLKCSLQDKLGTQFNSVLANLYRDGVDSMGSHRDNEKELGLNPIIASLSYGAPRKFIFRHIQSKKKVDLVLEHGSLLVMKGKTQEFWKHELPKSKKVAGKRINLTFRKIHLLRGE